MFGDFSITVSPCCISGDNRGISLVVLRRDLSKRRRWWTAMCLGNRQRIAPHLHPGLHLLHECLASEIDLLSQPVPNTLFPTFGDEFPVSSDSLFPDFAELTRLAQGVKTGRCTASVPKNYDAICSLLSPNSRGEQGYSALIYFTNCATNGAERCGAHPPAFSPPFAPVPDEILRLDPYFKKVDTPV